MASGPRKILCGLAMIGALSTTGATCGSAGSTGLVAAYSFDNNSTAVSDASGNGNGGTATNTAWVASGKYGGAFSFDGATSLVTVPDSASLHFTSGYTVEAWVNPAAPLGRTWQAVAVKEQQSGVVFGLYANSNRLGPAAIASVGNEKTAYGPVQLTAGRWTHLAETYDGSAVRLYVDGTLAGTTAAPGAPPASTSPLRFGGDSVAKEFLHGLIDEVRVYSRALTVSQIAADMSTPIGAGPAPTPKPPGGASLVNLHPEFHARLGMTMQVTATGSMDDSVRVALAGPVSKTLYASNGPLPTSTVKIAWNMRDLPAGSYTLRSQLLDKTGAVLINQVETFSRGYDGWDVSGSTNKGPAVGFDENNGIFVNGKPKFIISDFLDNQTGVAANGPTGADVVNGNIGHFNPNETGATWGTFLGTCAAALVYCSGPTAVQPYDRPDTWFVPYISAVKGNPYFYMHQWQEEPEIKSFPTETSQAQKADEVRRWTDISHANDYTHPVRMNFVGQNWEGGNPYNVRTVETYSLCRIVPTDPSCPAGGTAKPLVADLYSEDFYPVDLWNGHLMNPAATTWLTSKQMAFDFISHINANMKAWTKDLVPRSAYVEIANANNRTYTSGAALPTPVEVWAETWMNIVAGVKDLSWFNHFGASAPGVSAKLTQALATTGHYQAALEGADSQDVSLASTGSVDNSGPTPNAPRLQYLTKTDPADPTKRYVFAVNSDLNAAATGTFTAVGGYQIGTVKAVDGYSGTTPVNSRTLTVNHNSFTDTFAPLQVHIYELSP